MDSFNLKTLSARIFTPGLKKFSDLHKGDSCYVIGNGLSIKWFDLSLFADLPSIGCNMLPFHKDFLKLDARCITLVEPWYFAPKILQHKGYHASRIISREFRNIVRSTPDKEYFINLSNVLSFSGKNVNYVYQGLPEIRGQTDRLLSEFNLFGGGFHAPLCLAYYLGFSKIYLIGFDAWTVLPYQWRRFCEYGKGYFTDDVPASDAILEIVKKEVDIYTISVGGRSNNVKYIDYEEYTGKPPVFKENYEIIDDKYLRALATNSFYKIYPVDSSIL